MRHLGGPVRDQLDGEEARRSCAHRSVVAPAGTSAKLPHAHARAQDGGPPPSSSGALPPVKRLNFSLHGDAEGGGGNAPSPGVSESGGGGPNSLIVATKAAAFANNMRMRKASRMDLSEGGGGARDDLPRFQGCVDTYHEQWITRFVKSIRRGRLSDLKKLVAIGERERELDGAPVPPFVAPRRARDGQRHVRCAAVPADQDMPPETSFLVNNDVTFLPAGDYPEVLSADMVVRTGQLDTLCFLVRGGLGAAARPCSPRHASSPEAAWRLGGHALSFLCARSRCRGVRKRLPRCRCALSVAAPQVSKCRCSLSYRALRFLVHHWEGVPPAYGSAVQILLQYMLIHPGESHRRPHLRARLASSAAGVWALGGKAARGHAHGGKRRREQPQECVCEG